MRNRKFREFTALVPKKSRMVNDLNRDCTEPSRQIWAWAFPDKPWPEGLRVEWSNRLSRCWGEYLPHRQLVRLNLLAFENIEVMRTVYQFPKGAHDGPWHTLVHEFVHVLGFYKHDVRFRLILNCTLMKMGLDR